MVPYTLVHINLPLFQYQYFRQSLSAALKAIRLFLALTLRRCYLVPPLTRISSTLRYTTCFNGD